MGQGLKTRDHPMGTEVVGFEKTKHAWGRTRRSAIINALESPYSDPAWGVFDEIYRMSLFALANKLRKDGK